MAIIKLNNGMECLVDDCDYEMLSQYKWYFDGKYAQVGVYDKTTKKTNKLRMHAEIMKTPKGMQVDHINRNELDNRRCNLRLCTNAENNRNKNILKNNKSGLKGVSSHQGGYRAKIRAFDKNLCLGVFPTKEQAARVYDIWATFYHGEFAMTNKKLGLLG